MYLNLFLILNFSGALRFESLLGKDDSNPTHLLSTVSPALRQKSLLPTEI